MRRAPQRSLIVPLMLTLFALLPGCALDASDAEQLEYAGRQDRAQAPGQRTVKTDGDGSAMPGPDDQRTWQYKLVYSDVILSPDGRLLLAMVPAPGPGKGFAAPGLVLLARDLQSGVEHLLPDLVDLRRINFSADGAVAWLLRADGQTVTQLDLATLEPGPSHKLDSVFTVLDVTPEGRYLLLSNVARAAVEANPYPPHCGGILGASYDGKEADRCHVGVIDLKTGQAHTFATPEPVRDLDFSPAHDEVLLTWSRLVDGQPRATVAFYDPATASTTALVEVANCAGELKRVPGSNLALMAPTTCGRDPISIFDLAKRAHVEDLPGYGPVAISADGKTAIGFTRRQDMIDTWGTTSQNTKTGLIFIDLASRSWQVVDYGERLPGWTLSPDGQWLYTFEHNNLARWHVPTRERTAVTDKVAPERFVWSADGKQMHFLTGGNLFRLDAGAATIAQVPMDQQAELINIRPQEDFLVLGRRHAPTFYAVPLHGEGEVTELHLGL